MATILIVDDEPLNVDLLVQELGDLGYQTDTAFGGREALEKVSASPPDLILLDVVMPDLDGITVCRMLKDDPATQLIPIVIMTALDAKEDRIRGIEAGADDFLTKPVDDRELLARIKTALRTKAAVDETVTELESASERLEGIERILGTSSVAGAAGQSQTGQPSRALATMLMTDLVESTQMAARLGDETWTALLETHYDAVRSTLSTYNGDEISTAGDGFLAVFSQPAQAIRAGLEIAAGTAGTDLEVRVGIHTGEVEWRHGDIHGIGVHIAARVMAAAAGGEVLVTSTTRDSVAGSGLHFDDRGEKTLKGIDEPRHLYAAQPIER